MKPKAIFILSVSILFSCSEKKARQLSEIKLSTPDSKTISFAEIKNKRATVFIFLKPDCPLSQNYTLSLNALYLNFKNDSISFIGIIPCCVSDSEANDFISRYKILFPVVMDSKNETVNYFKATCTPEVFVVDADENVLYKGAIDDWAISIGKHRTVITENYLSDVLNQIKNNSTVSLHQTKAVGCVIEKIN